MEVRTGSHSAYRLEYHVVWATKYRRRILKPGVCAYLKKLLKGLEKGIVGVEIETIGFDKDHLHMVMVIPPRYSISSVIGKIKKSIGVPVAQEVYLARESVLGRERSLVSRLFRK